ncbi:MAG: hypothetical protein U1E14_20585 [Geminicoccaceae bacterium]
MRMPLLAAGIALSGGSAPPVLLVPASTWAIVAAETEDSVGCFMAAELGRGATLAVGVWHGLTGHDRISLAFQQDDWNVAAAGPLTATVAVDGVPVPLEDLPAPLPSGTGFSLPLPAAPALFDRLAAGARLDVTVGGIALAVDLTAAGASFVETVACAAAQPMPPPHPPGAVHAL